MNINFLISGWTRLRIEPQSTVSVADAQSNPQLLLSVSACCQQSCCGKLSGMIKIEAMGLVSLDNRQVTKGRSFRYRDYSTKYVSHCTF